MRIICLVADVHRAGSTASFCKARNICLVAKEVEIKRLCVVASRIDSACKTRAIIHEVLVAIADRPDLPVHQAVALHALSVLDALGILAEATETIAFGIASAQVEPATISVDRVDRNHLQLRFRLCPRLYRKGDEIGFADHNARIIRTIVGISLLVVIRLLAVRLDLVCISVSDDTTVGDTIGIGASTIVGNMTRTGAPAEAVHSVHSAATRRHAECVGTAARQSAMRTGAVLLTKHRSVRSDATAVIRASPTVTPVLKGGASARTRLAVASANAV